jgi:Ser/Thr protein kinase RdoA (MazF antagonist)
VSLRPTDADAQNVLRRFKLPAVAIESLGNAGGFSGARLWRVRTSQGDFCLKAWPPGGMTAEHHTEIARLMVHARESGLSFVPSVVYVPSFFPVVSHLEHAGCLWDLVAWMPGVADFHANPSPARLQAACAALAQLHRVWERFAAPPQPCPAVIRRLIVAGEWTNVTGPCPFGSPRSAWDVRAYAAVAAHLPAVQRRLEPWRDVAVTVQPCLCDVWHDHVLFTSDAVTGLIDYSALKVDNVAADLARLLGSLVGDDRPRFEMGLDAYASIRPLNRDERELAAVLDRTGVVLGLAGWLRRLYYHDPSIDDWDRVAKRIESLIVRVESWT